MRYVNSELSELYQGMIFDIVYEGMSDKDVAAKNGIPESKLHLIKRSKVWKSKERKMWNDLISLLVRRRNVSMQ